MAYQLLTGLFPYYQCGAEGLKGYGTRRVLDDVSAAAVRLDAPAFAALPARARGFVRALLEAEPARRPAAAEALRHPWLAEAAASAGAASA